MTPCRYLTHVEQMLSAYLQQLAPCSYIANCATFQTADQLRRVQLIAYRITQLQRAYPERGFATGERATWEQHRQAIRQAAELALVEYDWDRALVATQLVVKPVADLIFLDQLGRELSATGVELDSLIAENLWQDCERSRRWTAALVRFLADADPGNLAVLQGYLREWAARGHAMAVAGGELLATGGGRPSAEIRDRVVEGWRRLTEPVGLSVDPA